MKKIFLGITIGLLISTVGVYAVNYLASDVTYKNTTVESALNDLYNKKISGNDESEYLTNYESNNYICSICGGTRTKPSIEMNKNTATINMKNANTSQGTTYLEIEDILKYKYFLITIDGDADGISVFLHDNINDGFEISNTGINIPYSGSVKSLSTTIMFDVTEYTGKNYIIITGTYFNDIKITTQGILK